MVGYEDEIHNFNQIYIREHIGIHTEFAEALLSRFGSEPVKATKVNDDYIISDETYTLDEIWDAWDNKWGTNTRGNRLPGKGLTYGRSVIPEKVEKGILYYILSLEKFVLIINGIGDLKFDKAIEIR